MGNENEPVLYNLTENELRLAWMSANPVNVKAGQKLVTLKLKLIGTLSSDERIQLNMIANPLNELADGSVNVIPNVVLYADMIGAKSLGIADANGATLGFANYPNPFNETTTFVVNLPYSGVATIELFDMVGKRLNVVLDESMTSGDHKVTLNSNNLKPGVYTATLSLNADGKLLKRTIKIIRNQ